MRRGLDSFVDSLSFVQVLLLGGKFWCVFTEGNSWSLPPILLYIWEGNDLKSKNLDQ